jgi:hypothetical protein
MNRKPDTGLAPVLPGSPAWTVCREYRILLRQWIVSQDLAEDRDYLTYSKKERIYGEQARDKMRAYHRGWRARRDAQVDLRATKGSRAIPK